jgi:hypothetical protein
MSGAARFNASVERQKTIRGLQTAGDDPDDGDHRNREEHSSDARDLAAREHTHDHQRGMDVDAAGVSGSFCATRRTA